MYTHQSTVSNLRNIYNSVTVQLLYSMSTHVHYTCTFTIIKKGSYNYFMSMFITHMDLDGLFIKNSSHVYCLNLFYIILSERFLSYFMIVLGARGLVSL